MHEKEGLKMLNIVPAFLAIMAMDLGGLGRIGVLFSALINTFMPIAILIVIAVVVDDLIGIQLMRRFVKMW